MNNKLMFVFGLVAALIVALAFSSVSAKWFGKSAVQFAPNETNANDCSADEKCVIQNAIVEKSVEAPMANLVSMQGGFLRLFDASNANSPAIGFLSAERGFFIGRLNNPRDRAAFPYSGAQNIQGSYMGDTKISVESNFGPNLRETITLISAGLYGTLFNSANISTNNSGFSEVFTFSGAKISSNYLAGNGTAYACIDATGKLFRSKNPCR